MASSSALASLAGGALIGASASVMLLFLGRIAGVSGILASAFRPAEGEEGAGRVVFLVGLVVGGAIVSLVRPDAIGAPVLGSVPLAVGAGLLVGVGVELGGGCTSGHGVCGISRFAPRSIVATLTFIAVGMLTVFVAR